MRTFPMKKQTTPTSHVIPNMECTSTVGSSDEFFVGRRLQFLFSLLEGVWSYVPTNEQKLLPFGVREL